MRKKIWQWFQCHVFKTHAGKSVRTRLVEYGMTEHDGGHVESYCEVCK